MRPRDENELERFLDRTLSEYSSEAPRDGLEQRILANLAVNTARRRSPWWIWAAVPACAALIVGALLFWHAAGQPSPNPPIADVPKKEIPGPVAHDHTLTRSANVRKPPPGRRAVVSTVARLPKQNAPLHEPRLATFPSSPDGSQARMLLAFVQRHHALASAVAQEQEEFQKLAANRDSSPLN